MKSSNSLEKSLYKLSDSSLSITKKDGGYFDVDQFKDIEKIKQAYFDGFEQGNLIPLNEIIIGTIKNSTVMLNMTSSILTLIKVLAV